MSEKLYQDKDWLYEQYWVHEKSLTEIALLAKCNRTTIANWMAKLGIPRRSLARAIYLARVAYLQSQDPEYPKKLYMNKEWLYEQYWKRSKSSLQMAKVAKCSPQLIRQWMRRFDIPLRSPSEATHLRDKNPEWRKRCAEAALRRFQRPEEQKKHVQAMRHRAQDPKWRKQHAEITQRLALKRCNKGEMTSIEAICHAAFNSLDLDFVFEKFIYPYRVDFFFPSHGIIVEAMGKFWHEKPKRQKRDAERKQYLKAMGYTVLEWLGSDIKADVYKLIDEELLPLLDQPSRMERPPRGVSKPYRGPHGWKSAIQLYLFGKEQDD